ncbi:tyrosine-type recombinase/integrase [Aureispira sp. CCB-QB1]|uniref:tyrosine-type recombinase/integrase n=1 Tax=Aureispira sp. CCB-QB1 TaxID=1313421 RepID=UPI000696460E|nr:tyrosine-type recombinase/integrase [Aureispira sp. CCB-QB1]
MIKEYLETRHKMKTASSYYREWKDFESYLYQKNCSIQNVTYPLILNYVESLQKRSLKAKSINRKLMIIEKIYKHLLPNKNNPIKGLRVKTEGRSPLSEPIAIEDLSKLLKDLPRETAYQKRNVLMLSLIHHQALRVGEIKALKLQDIDLEKARIYVPKSNRSKSRSLELTALQVIELQDYIKTTRPELLQYKTNQLFITGGSSKSLQNSFLKLKKKLQKRLPKLKNLEHWRSSIIVHWLEHSPLLEVQQKLGHCYASSTERYKVYAVKNLQKALSVHHPLR